MRIFEIGKQLDQANKIRGLMDDYDSTPGRIKKPPGMKKYLFENRIKKLRDCEAKAKKILEQDIKQYIKEHD